MGEPAKKLDGDRVQQWTATVIAREGADYLVRVEGEKWHARCAPSCLLAPMVGDRVLVAVTEAPSAYLLAVLERDPSRPSEVVVPGDLSLRVERGQLSLSASDGVALRGAEVSVLASRVVMRALHADVVFDRLGYVGRLLRSEIDRVAVLAHAFDAVVDRYRQRVKSSYRTVEGSERLRAQEIDYTAEQMLSLRADTTLVTANELVKLDGEQIHVG